MFDTNPGCRHFTSVPRIEDFMRPPSVTVRVRVDVHTDLRHTYYVDSNAAGPA